MSHILDFGSKFVYDSRLEGITIDVRLQSGPDHLVSLPAKIDTGASYCLFERRYGLMLGLDIEAGERTVFSTVAGRVAAYGHEVIIEVLGYACTSTVYFFADDAIEKNVLGRRGWLDRIRPGIVDHDNALYLSPYSET